MNTILFPTDFSENAGKALDYAVKIALAHHAELELLTVYHGTLTDINYEDQTYSAPDIEVIHQEAITKLGELRTSISSEIPVKIAAIQGFAADEIVIFAEKMHADLIVMGTQGASGLEDVILGSVTSNVIRKSDCPVMAIPKDAPYNGLKKIGFATDLTLDDEETMNKILSLSSPFESQVSVFHVHDSELDTEYGILDDLNKKYNGKASFELIESNSIEEGIANYSADKELDLLVLFRQRRNFFEKLFHGSMTRKMALHSKVPVLIYKD